MKKLINSALVIIFTITMLWGGTSSVSAKTYTYGVLKSKVDTIPSLNIKAGESNVKIASYYIRSLEEISIKKMVLKIEGNTPDYAFNEFTIENKTGEVLATSYIINGHVIFNFNNNFTVEKYIPTNFIIKVDINQYDLGMIGMINTNFKVTPRYVKAYSTLTGNLVNGYVNALKLYSNEHKITTGQLLFSKSTAGSTSLKNGDNELLRFNVYSDTIEDVKLEFLNFKIETNKDISLIGDYRLYDEYHNLLATHSIVSSTFTMNLSNEYIAEGSIKNYILEATVSGVQYNQYLKTSIIDSNAFGENSTEYIEAKNLPISNLLTQY